MSVPWSFEVLPYRPAPYTDECLSGYLARLAMANRIPDLWQLAEDLFPQWRVTRQLSLLRWEYPLDGWGRLPLRTQLSPVTLNRLTVLAWVQKFRDPPVYCHPFRAGPGQILNGIIRLGDGVCPGCFAEASYLRLQWRFHTVTVCLAHGCWLEVVCPGCGQPLAVFSRRGLSVCCPGCGTDWRTVPRRAAPAAVLTAQHQQQAELHMLLNPETSLVRNLPPAVAATGGTAHRVGVKLRWLRLATGQSMSALAKQLDVAASTVSALERGMRVPLALYGRYLEAVGQSWPEVATLALTDAMVEQLTTPAHMALRRCPNLQCPTSQLPPGPHIILLRDLPDHRVARFRCTGCGRRFTRSYDGPITAKPAQPRSARPDLLRRQKTAEERALVMALGREGYPTRWIARQLGWGQKTVRTYWLALGMEAEVTEAQAAWRRRQQEQRQTSRRAGLEPVLQHVLSGEQAVVLRDVARALGYNGDYLQSHPILAADVHTRLAQHNAEARARQNVAQTARVVAYCQALAEATGPVMLKTALGELGITWKVLRERYPDLALLLQTTVRSCQQQQRAARLTAQLAEIDAAADRLHARGVRLSQRAILLEAGLSLHSGVNLMLRQRLQHWVGDFPWNE